MNMNLLQHDRTCQDYRKTTRTEVKPAIILILVQTKTAQTEIELCLGKRSVGGWWHVVSGPEHVI